MEYTDAICHDANNYTKFVLPDYQYVCGSAEYNETSQIWEENKTAELQQIDGKLPCCDVNPAYDTKGKGLEHFLDEGRKSFMSGHSSFSFYCATFLVIYLHVRLSKDHLGDGMLVKENTIVFRTLLRYIEL